MGFGIVEYLIAFVVLIILLLVFRHWTVVWLSEVFSWIAGFWKGA
jgi:hypothetical protein